MTRSRKRGRSNRLRRFGESLMIAAIGGAAHSLTVFLAVVTLALAIRFWPQRTA